MGPHDHDGIMSRRRFLQAAVLGSASIAISNWTGPFPIGRAAGAEDDDPPDDLDVFEGELVQNLDNALVVDVDGVQRLVATDAASTFWKGGEVSQSQFLIGDMVMVKLLIGQPVQRAWSNLGRVYGTILNTINNGYRISAYDYHTPEITYELDVVVSDQTDCEDAYTGAPLSPWSLPVGTAMDVIGLRETGAIVASSIDCILQGAQPPDPPASGPSAVYSYTVNGVPRCDFQYRGYAGWFECPTGRGRCSTCDSNKSDQCAWPAMDSSCECCTSSCCNCSNGCKNQVYLTCGTKIKVADQCTDRTKSIKIVDCGPCQKPPGTCSRCRQDLCTRTCKECPGGSRAKTAVVDLTKPTYARFYDPVGTRRCFPCTVTVIGVPC